MEKSNTKIKIIFFGTSDFAVPALEDLARAGNRRGGASYEIVAVITNPDEPAGRKKALAPPPIKIAAQKIGVTVLQPEKIRNNPEIIQTLNGLGPQIGVVAAYGKIIPLEIINLPKFGTLNIHPSLLPKYRGPSPIQSSILNGEKTTGVTIIKIDEEADHGPILAQGEYAAEGLSYQELHNKLARQGADLLVKTLEGYLEGNIQPRAQDHAQATFTKIIKTEDAEIKTSDSGVVSRNKVLAFNPNPGAFTYLDHKGQKIRLKILEAQFIQNKNGETGSTIFNNMPALGFDDGVLILKKVQPAGGKPVCGEEFLRGHEQFFLNK